MAPYRDNARWGELVATHRTLALSWLGAGIAAIPAAYLCFHFAQTTQRDPTKLWVGVLVFLVLGGGMLFEFVRLTRIAVRRYARGFVYFDGNVEHEVEWSEITSVEGQHVKGALGRGAADPGNLVSLVVTFPRGTISLPRELGGFRDLTAELRKHATAATWIDVTIASLLQRT